MNGRRGTSTFCFAAAGREGGATVVLTWPTCRVSCRGRGDGFVLTANPAPGGRWGMDSGAMESQHATEATSFEELSASLQAVMAAATDGKTVTSPIGDGKDQSERYVSVHNPRVPLIPAYAHLLVLTINILGISITRQLSRRQTSLPSRQVALWVKPRLAMTKSCQKCCRCLVRYQ